MYLLSIALMMGFLGYVYPQSMGTLGGPGNNLGPSYEQIQNGIQRELERRQREEDERNERNRRLEASNHFTREDYEAVLRDKLSDLKAVNAMLFKYKDDFRQVRERQDQDGDYTRHKVKQIFNSEIFRYTPIRDLYPLVWGLFQDLKGSDISKEEKLFHLRNKITIMKHDLIYARNIAIHKNVSLFRIFVYLYHLDIRIALARHNCEYQRTNEACSLFSELLKEADKNAWQG